MISDFEFTEAWKNEDNAKIITRATRKYSNYIPKDELLSCKMVGLWECLKNYKVELGGKFTTYLYRGIQIECVRYLYTQRNKKTKTIRVETVAEDEIMMKDCIETLDMEYQHLIHNRYYKRMTLKEIGEENGYSHETARRKINKALCKLKRILLK